jgi:hypothetical protein
MLVETPRPAAEAAPSPSPAAPAPTPPRASEDEITELLEQIAETSDRLTSAITFLDTVDERTAEARANVEQLPAELGALLARFAAATGAELPGAALVRDLTPAPPPAAPAPTPDRLKMPRHRSTIARSGKRKPYAATAVGGPTLAGRVLELLGRSEPMPADAIARALREPVPDVQHALAGLWSARRVEKDERVRPALWSAAAAERGAA